LGGERKFPAATTVGILSKTPFPGRFFSRPFRMQLILYDTVFTKVNGYFAPQL
jgi:hypothetical protein